MALLELHQLQKAYADQRVPAVHALTLNIARGEFITLLGPSGCGKTTTLRMIAGFIKPTGGLIRLDGRVLADAMNGVFVPPEARGMGMVFQSYAVWPHMTVFNNIAYPLRLRRTARAEIDRRVTAMLELVGLHGFARRYPNQLSGGQQQRVALARALIAEPQVLLLDEPLSNLDAQLREAMRSELIDLHRRTGMTIVYVTHDQAEALAMSDRVVIMRQGTALQIGTPVDVYHRPAHPFVAEFIGAANILPCRVSGWAAGEAQVTLPGSDRLIPAVHALDQPPDAPLLVVRPEQMRLHPADAGWLSGTVLRRQFLGEAHEISIETTYGAVRARVASGDAPALGASVGVTWEGGWLVAG
ncbi:MAG: ABC transporter ATP-binding protein [Candidatus Flexifilum sp.]|jgi:iron(III) transport system ATP-binding protein